MRTVLLPFFLAAVLLLSACGPAEPVPSAQAPAPVDSEAVFVRVNLVGYRSDDPKVAIAFSHSPVEGRFVVVDSAASEVVFTDMLRPVEAEGWGTFDHFYALDFSAVTEPGRYYMRVEATGDRSPTFAVGPEAYGHYQAALLAFMRQQRCGYNPFLDAVCHRRDGRSMYGPMPDSTFIDAAGGWHDAGDQLKYLLTASNATANLLLAYLLEPDKFGDAVDALGHPRPNGVPDVLDEARWGLRWMHKLHPKPGQLFHQVADDRDHIGWKLPGKEDPSDYGWGPDSYRVVYYANGEPQGLGEYKSASTGVANLAGRSAAAMAMAYRIWQNDGANDVSDPAFAARCLRAAKDVYRLGKGDPGVQQGNSYGSPYRYGEITWADDMEWGAAALYAATGEEQYLADAKRYARRIGTTSWIPRDTTAHYAYYPFVNVGHFALYRHVNAAFQDTLAGYYRQGLERARRRGRTNPYRIGVPFIWCSNNLASALITQGLLYERMTGDSTYHDFIIAQRDWLLGRNPWGTPMCTGIPRGGEYPEDIHTSIWALTGRFVPGGLVDGPVYATIYNSLAGLTLTEPDEFARFQTNYVVYHDDRGDYTTNEPTMDGTATAVPWMAHFGAPVQR